MGEDGLASADGEVRLRSFRDTCTFDRASGVLLERTIELSYLRKDHPMIQTSRRTLREVWSREQPFDRPGTGPSALALRDAFRVASTDPREACRRLLDWSRDGLLGYRALEDVAPQIWLVASRAEREHSRALLMARRLGPPADTGLALADEDSFEALHRGRLSALFTHLGLDGPRHRAAYQAALERRGLDPRLVGFLMRVHDEARAPDLDPVPGPQRSQAEAVLVRALEELGEAR